MSVRKQIIIRMLVLLLSCYGMASVCSAQAIETETARFLPARASEFSTAYEFQTSKEGTERAVPLAFEYGVTDRLSFLVEPVVYSSIRPKRRPGATDVGDLELTTFYLLNHEGGSMPAFAAAAEAKIPMTKNPVISTGQTDFTGYLIASKRVGRVDAHANLGYTIFGQPPGAQLNNIFDGAVALECHLGQRLLLFGEMLGNTSSAPEGGGDNPSNPSTVVPEAAGGELVGTAGVGFTPVRNLLLSLGVSYDNNHAVLLRPGVSYRMR